MSLVKKGVCTLLLCAISSVVAQTKIVTSNPILTDWYADPEMAIFENTYWLFPTFSGVTKKQDFIDIFSSNDLKQWTKYDKVVDPSNVKWAKDAVWAPSAIQKDSTYYIFFSANDIQTPESHWWDPKVHDSTEVGGIGVVRAKHPEGPYVDHIGKPLIGTVVNGAQPIDQSIFRDHDGTHYIMYGGWGHCNIGMLNDDFTALKPFADGSLLKEITPENYVEGPVMFYKDGHYYLMWSEGSWGRDSYRVAYGRAKSPLGPFDRIATILASNPEIATGAGHNSVLNVPGTDEWYILYHRRPIPNEHRNHRVVCIDRMYFNEDGTILPIIMTHTGVPPIPLENE
ncbi:glycoside hydrolase family 43 protein [Maribacter sp. 2-571]|uniref:glycoside hydrolase family 43 protein n=1 Tax=Maribacter sp. 2-571 TaxID=3417569 RepID=UPI003D32DDE3